MTELRDRLAVINGLRGAAILAVMGHHLFSRFAPESPPWAMVFGVPLTPVAPLHAGWLGVDLFFVLSGLVLVILALSAITYRFVEFRAVDDWRSLFRGVNVRRGSVGR